MSIFVLYTFNKTYKMEQIITALQNWESVRNNPSELIALFANKSGLVLDMNLFPAGIPLHAYAGIKNDVFGFYVISEANDVNSSMEVLSANCHWCPCTNQKNQVITEEEALLRISSWQNDFEGWLNNVVTMPFGMYQTFHIPTTDLQPESYHVLFALKNDPITPAIKAADLVLKNDAGVYFDTVYGEPPYKYSDKYYILTLL